MQLSDDLVRIDMLVENMVRKIEKQYTEVAGESPEALKVSNLPIRPSINYPSTHQPIYHQATNNLNNRSIDQANVCPSKYRSRNAIT